jgi:hypothetical protein
VALGFIQAESWDDLADPVGLDLPAVRPIRDDIERRVRRLIHELEIQPQAAALAE